MTLYETQILFFIGFTFPSILHAYYGSTYPKKDELDIRGALLQTYMPMNTLMVNAHRYKISQPDMRIFEDEEINPLKRTAPMFGRAQQDYLQEPLQPYRRIRSFKTHSLDNYVVTWEDPEHKQWFTNRFLSPDFKNVITPENGPLFPREFKRSSASIDNHFEYMGQQVSRSEKRQTALSPPREWCRIFKLDARECRLGREIP